jgi:hypothetical protein
LKNHGENKNSQGGMHLNDHRESTLIQRGMQITNEAIHRKYIIEPYNKKSIKKSDRLNSSNLS